MARAKSDWIVGVSVTMCYGVCVMYCLLCCHSYTMPSKMPTTCTW